MGVFTAFWGRKPVYQLVAKDEYDAEAARPLSDPSRRRKTLFIVFALTISFVAGWFISRSNFITTAGARCSKPRIRREWRTLSTKEKLEYTDAVQCLYSQPSKLFDDGRVTDDFAWVHVMNSMETHYLPTFLLWHRYFIWLYESMLRETCGYSGSLPYWEWALDWEDPSSSPVWDADTGFGGDGEGEITVKTGRCVQDGPFAGSQIRYINNITSPHCLSRHFDFQGHKFAPNVLDELFDHERLASFSFDLEKHSHDAIPNGVGGDFATFTAPSDPIWFLHHSNIDRLFWKWQQGSSDRINIQMLRKESESMRKSLDASMPMLQFAEELPAREVLDTRSDMLCYSYL